MKSLFDKSAALLALVFLSPLLAVVAGLVCALLGRPVLFRQVRPGLQARLFTLYKFRTMRELAGFGAGSGAAARSDAPADARADARAAVLTDASRLTAFGRLLRRTSIDELPQLFNILKGDMSVVGPRPLLPEYLPLYTSEQARRHNVLPGLTGWAQVNGRNAITWEEKLALDVWYVDHRSFWLDLSIVFRTIQQTFSSILRGSGVNQAGQATVAPFAGSVVAEPETTSTPAEASQ